MLSNTGSKPQHKHQQLTGFWSETYLWEKMTRHDKYNCNKTQNYYEKKSILGFVTFHIFVFISNSQRHDFYGGGRSGFEEKVTEIRNWVTPVTKKTKMKTKEGVRLIMDATTNSSCKAALRTPIPVIDIANWLCP